VDKEDLLLFLLAFVFVVYLLVSPWLDKRRERQLDAARPFRAVCDGCEHPWSFHGTDGGCAHLVDTDSPAEPENTCRCLKYDGPDPVNSMHTLKALDAPHHTDNTTT
jgi:hypothetical protein